MEKLKNQKEDSAYLRKVKAVELAIKSQGKPAFVKTVLDAAKKIFEYINSED